MENEIRRLPDAELEVMQAVWDCEPPVHRSDIDRRLSGENPKAMTTVLTLLSRLCDKGFLRQEKEGRSNLYTPLVSRRDYLAAQSRSIVKTLFGGSMSAFASALCDSGLTKEELAQLRDALEKGTL